jgi:phosphomannomutase
MTFVIPSDLMVSVSGVRGRLGEGLTPEVVARFAAAFGAYLGDRAPRSRSGQVPPSSAVADGVASAERSAGHRPRVVLARDSRTSGPMFTAAVTAGLQSVGCDILSAGLVPTPTALYAIRHHAADGGIVVTASHNPVEWNALKFASADGMFLDAQEAPRMRAYVSDRPIPRAGWDGLGSVTVDEGAVRRHLDAVLAIPFLDVDALRRRRFRVALDCVRGAGAALLPALLEGLGCEVIGIHLEPDGRFPRPPEPVAENLGELERLVRDSGADIGMATDPDADRLALVSDAGRAIGEDLTLTLATMLVLRHRTGPVVTNLSTSRVLEDVVRDAGGTLERAPVGEINVARAMERAGAVIGGEGNGGVILPDVHLTRDSAIAAALVLQLMLEVERPIGELVGGLPPYTIVKDKLPRDAGSLEAAFGVLESSLDAAAADRQDGLRLDWPETKRWLHLRASGTEPILRIIAEAPTASEARQLVDRARAALAGAGGGP